VRERSASGLAAVASQVVFGLQVGNVVGNVKLTSQFMPLLQ